MRVLWPTRRMRPRSVVSLPALLEPLLAPLAPLLDRLLALLAALLPGLELGHARRAQPSRGGGDHDRDDHQRDEQGGNELAVLAAHGGSARKSPADVSQVTASRKKTVSPRAGRKRLRL